MPVSMTRRGAEQSSGGVAAALPCYMLLSNRAVEGACRH